MNGISRFTVIAARTLHFLTAGSGSQDLVLLHGLTDDANCWGRVVDALATDHSMVIPDARGHGRSDRLDGAGTSMRILTEDVVGLLERLELRRPTLFGHSMGAITAAAVAAARPDLVGALVLEDPPFDIADVPLAVRRSTMKADVERWRCLGAATRHERAASEHPEWHRKETDAWVDAKTSVDPAIFDHLDIFDDYDWRSDLRRLTVPGMLLTGDPGRGAIITRAVAEEALALWSKATELHVEEAGHCIHRDAFPRSMTAIRSFLAEAFPTTP